MGNPAEQPTIEERGKLKKKLKEVGVNVHSEEDLKDEGKVMKANEIWAEHYKEHELAQKVLAWSKMDDKEAAVGKIKELQASLEATQDGIIGYETISKFNKVLEKEENDEQYKKVKANIDGIDGIKTKEVADTKKKVSGHFDSLAAKVKNIKPGDTPSSDLTDHEWNKLAYDPKTELFRWTWTNDTKYYGTDGEYHDVWESGEYRKYHDAGSKEYKDNMAAAIISNSPVELPEGVKLVTAVNGIKTIERILDDGTIQNWTGNQWQETPESKAVDQLAHSMDDIKHGQYWENIKNVSLVTFLGYTDASIDWVTWITDAEKWAIKWIRDTYKSLSETDQKALGDVTLEKYQKMMKDPAEAEKYFVTNASSWVNYEIWETYSRLPARLWDGSQYAYIDYTTFKKRSDGKLLALQGGFSPVPSEFKALNETFKTPGSYGLPEGKFLRVNISKGNYEYFVADDEHGDAKWAINKDGVLEP